MHLHKLPAEILLQVAEGLQSTQDSLYAVTPAVGRYGSLHNWGKYKKTLVRLLDIARGSNLPADIYTRDAAGRTPLHFAVKTGHEDLVRLLLDNYDASVDSQFWQQFRSSVVSRTAGVLDYNCRDESARDFEVRESRDDRGCPTTTAILKVEYINRVDRSGRAPIHYAVCSDDWELVRLLLSYGANVDARFWQPPVLVKILTNHGYTAITPDYKIPWVDSYIEECGQILSKYVRHFALTGRVNCSYVNRATALHHSANTGQILAVKMLVEQFKAEINCRDEGGWTPLHAALFGGHNQIVSYLLKKGARPDNPPPDRGSEPSRIQVPPAYWCDAMIPYPGGYLEPVDVAIISGNMTGLTLLLAYGADILYKSILGTIQLHKVEIFFFLLPHLGVHVDGFPEENDWWGPPLLHEAALRSNIPIMRGLLKAGARLSTVDSRGRGPLEYAVEGGSLVAVKMLLEAGADPNRLFCRRQLHNECPSLLSPVLLAVWYGNIEMLDLLVEYGADLKGEKGHDAIMVGVKARQIWMLHILYYREGARTKRDSGYVVAFPHVASSGPIPLLFPDCEEWTTY